MKAEHIPLLRCVDCTGALKLVNAVFVGDVVDCGRLVCQDCGRSYPIIDTVAVCFRDDVVLDYLSQREVDFITAKGWNDCLVSRGGGKAQWHAAQKSVADNWAYQWDVLADDWRAEDFAGPGLLSAKAFWNFVQIEPQEVLGKKVLVTCGGLGREARHVVDAGAAEVMVNEIGVEIYKIRKNVPGADDKLILLRSDACHLPLGPGVADIAICDHALQHIPNHVDAFQELAAKARSGGQVIICVYSWENNAIMTHMVEPSKQLIHRLPLKGQRVLALPLALAVFALTRGLYAPLGRFAPGVGCRLPLFEHMRFWSEFPFSVLWLSIFDLLHAPVSYHFRKAEVEGLSASAGLRTRRLVNTNGTLWSLVAVKP
ncbi:MAG: methyltransferase domain-containing protein [Alphaproteobacteria bacterium]|nr:methyltransferase domain-containing protein [Alphaproteobacteria bacterium]